MTYPCAKGAAVHSILCLCSKLRFCALGSRARLGDRGQQRKKKEQHGRTRDSESPGPGQEDAQEKAVGLRQSWVHPQADWRRGVQQSAFLPKQEEKAGAGAGAPKHSPKLQPQQKEKNHLEKSLAMIVL